MIEILEFTRSTNKMIYATGVRKSGNKIFRHQAYEVADTLTPKRIGNIKGAAFSCTDSDSLFRLNRKTKH